MTAAEPTGRDQRFTQLDALRFFFAVVVVLVHTIGFKLTLVHGAFAVDFFFVLSGFVLSHALISRPMSAQAFTWARLARLYPLHLATLAWMVWLVGGIRSDAPAEYSATALALNLGLLQGLGILQVQTWNFPSWSISVEFLVNVLIFYPLVARRSVWVAVAVVLAAVLTILLAWGPVFDQFNVQKVYGTVLSGAVLRGTAGIVLGYLLYELHLVARRRFDAQRLQLPATCFEVVALALVGFCLWVDDFRWNLLPAPLCAVLVFQMATVPGWLSRLLQSGPFAMLGNMSYSIYLLHVPLYMTFLGAGALPMPDTSFTPVWFVFFGLLLALAAASFRYLERPAQQRLRRLFSA
jgi:peptidoglycan/LPS O-acetylase OafA/YrhL